MEGQAAQANTVLLPLPVYQPTMQLQPVMLRQVCPQENMTGTLHTTDNGRTFSFTLQGALQNPSSAFRQPIMLRQASPQEGSTTQLYRLVPVQQAEIDIRNTKDVRSLHNTKARQTTSFMLQGALKNPVDSGQEVEGRASLRCNK